MEITKKRWVYYLKLIICAASTFNTSFEFGEAKVPVVISDTGGHPEFSYLHDKVYYGRIHYFIKVVF